MSPHGRSERGGGATVTTHNQGASERQLDFDMGKA